MRLMKADDPNAEFWGWVAVVATAALLAVVIFIPSQPGASASNKFYLTGLALVWMGWGIARVRVARKLKKQLGHVAKKEG